MTNRLGYRPELDGVRAFAVLAVLGFHLSFLWTPLGHVARGGFLGVDIFFVLSGMLITEILTADYERTGSLGFSSFYARRARRLLPALVTFIVLTTVWYQLVDGTGRAALKGLVSVASYVTVGHFVGPFPPGTNHLWTLVVEWEFYLLWPAVLLGLLRLRLSPRTIGTVAAVAAVLVAVAGAVVYHHDGNFVLSYHLAWLRFSELLAGCAVGLLGDRPAAPNPLRYLGFLVLIVVVVRTVSTDGWLYEYGMALIAISTAVVVQPRSVPWGMDRLLSWRPLVWVGKISYSLYLWSVFVCSVVLHHLSSWPAGLRLVAATAISFALAWASYELIERPFRKPSQRLATS